MWVTESNKGMPDYPVYVFKMVTMDSEQDLEHLSTSHCILLADYNIICLSVRFTYIQVKRS